MSEITATYALTAFIMLLSLAFGAIWVLNGIPTNRNFKPKK